MSVTIRRATIEDIPIIARHRVAMFHDMGQLSDALKPDMERTTLALLPRTRPPGESVGWLAVPERAPPTVGAGAGAQLWSVQPYLRRSAGGASSVGDGRQALVVNVYTEPGYRRCGIARRLMREIIDWAQAEGIARVNLHASDAGRPLYESLGFTPTNEMRMNF